MFLICSRDVESYPDAGILLKEKLGAPCEQRFRALHPLRDASWWSGSRGGLTHHL